MLSFESEIISKIHKIAIDRGGTCLSNKYINSNTKLSFRCIEGHEWESIPSTILKGHWCKICGNISQGKKKSLSISDMKNLAISKGGICLSDDYKNNRTKLSWQCGKGHIWEATADIIRNQGSWCPKCFGKDKVTNLRTIQEIAIQRGGFCLTDQYTRAHAKMEFQCSSGHIWSASATSIKSGSWCQKCHNLEIGSEENGITIQFLDTIAKKRGGKLVSDSYVNSGTPIEWDCANGHRWFAKYDHIKNDSWCPICSAGLSENITRLILERITEKPFPKIRPKWLLSNTGKRLELDGYNEELGIAFEYNGIQHYKNNEFFHNSENALDKRQIDDLQKLNLCREHNVYLIVVRYDIPKEEIFPNLLNELEKHPNAKNIIRNKTGIDFRDLNIWKRNDIFDLKNIAVSRGGLCLSNIYQGSTVKLRWQCTKEHLWDATPSDIKSGRWCPACAGKDKDENYRRIIQKVQEKGGKCLFDRYINSQTKLLIECENGHRWLTSYSSLKHGRWCKQCNYKQHKHKNNKYSLITFQGIASNKGGKCMSTEYKNTESRLLFQCNEGHEWIASAWSILKGSWCRKCVQKKNKPSI